MADITIDEDFHGPVDDRQLHHEPTFILRGLTDLHLRFMHPVATGPAVGMRIAAVCGAALVAAVTATQRAGRRCRAQRNLLATSNGDWATTNDVYRNERARGVRGSIEA